MMIIFWVFLRGYFLVGVGGVSGWLGPFLIQLKCNCIYFHFQLPAITYQGYGCAAGYARSYWVWDKNACWQVVSQSPGTSAVFSPYSLHYKPRGALLVLMYEQASRVRHYHCVLLFSPNVNIMNVYAMQWCETGVIVFAGTQQYSKYTGYAQTYQWSGRHHDTTPRYNHFHWCFCHSLNHWNKPFSWVVTAPQSSGSW